MSTMISPDRLQQRQQIVDRHLASEHARDLQGVMQTFSDRPILDFPSTGEIYCGYDEVHGTYADLFNGFPNLQIEIKNSYATADTIVVEFVMKGQHTDTWKGIEPTNRQMILPSCCLFFFDDRDQISQERVYLDVATVWKQLGLNAA